MSEHGRMESKGGDRDPGGARGRSLIAGEESGAGGAGVFRAVNPRTGEELDPGFVCATPADVDRAARAAGSVAAGWGALPAPRRAGALERIAASLDAARLLIVARAAAETGLPEPRLGREFDRMTSTLRMFARAVVEGSWSGACIDHPAPGAERGSIAAHDLRRVRIPLGPVGVFGASNFPLAYGVAGGDTASALAAGCPVIVKGHPSHPGTGELVARAVAGAIADERIDPRIFSYLHSGGEHEMTVGSSLVTHPEIRAIGFTGSFRGGMALVAAANERPEPVPVFAEMGSTNPVFILPAAARERGDEIARLLAASILDSSGQQCTCPGILFLVADAPGGKEIVAAIERALTDAPPSIMLSRRVRDGYRARVRECLGVGGVTCSDGLRRMTASELPQDGPVTAPSGLLQTTVPTFASAAVLRDEIFGPAVLAVDCLDFPEMLRAASIVRGSLTGSLFAAPDDRSIAETLLPVLMRRVGRLVFDGVPTGVRVAPSMVHGGPYPATNRPDSTAVGYFAMERWTRPLCFQNAPATLLPTALGDDAPDSALRLIDGRWEHP